METAAACCSAACWNASHPNAASALEPRGVSAISSESKATVCLYPCTVLTLIIFPQLSAAEKTLFAGGGFFSFYISDVSFKSVCISKGSLCCICLLVLVFLNCLSKHLFCSFADFNLICVKWTKSEIGQPLKKWRTLPLASPQPHFNLMNAVHLKRAVIHLLQVWNYSKTAPNIHSSLFLPSERWCCDAPRLHG